MTMFNEGDTAVLMLNYKLNGEDLVENAYDEIELQINSQTNFYSLKKLLSAGDIEWGTVVYDTTDDQGQEQEATFTGYVASLTQEETFKLKKGTWQAQLRILVNGEVGSSGISALDIGDALSTKVLE